MEKLLNMIPDVVANRISVRRKKQHCLPFVASLGLIQTAVYGTVHDILTHTLIHLRDVEKNLKYWQSVSDKASCPEFLRTVTRLSKLRCSLCTFLSKVYAENDKFKEPAYIGWDESRLLVLYILSIHNHFLELERALQEKTLYAARAGLSILLEESFKDKIPYPASATESLSFKKLGDENEDLLLLKWSADNFRDAVDLLSSNLNKLDDYVSFLVVKYRKPSKTSRRRMYYTFGAIGVSVFSLWLLRHGRLSGVVHSWVLEAKELVTGLLIDPIKQMTLVNRRHKEMMKLKQVQSTRDFSFKKELNYLSGEDSARPMLNQIQKITHGVETAKELSELSHELFMDSERLLVSLAAIPAIVFCFGGIMLSYALVKQVLGEGRNDQAQAQIRLLVKEVEERFIELSHCPSESFHYNHGLMLCTLDRLYRAEEKSAKKNGEWQSLREELTALGKLTFADSGKRVVISHIKEKYGLGRMVQI